MMIWSVFFFSPRSRTFMKPNWRLITRNGCSTLARMPALSFSIWSISLCSSLFSLSSALVAGIGVDILFFTVQQAVAFHNIVDVGCGAAHGVNQARLCVGADVRFAPEKTLIAFLGEMHLGVTGFTFVLGGAWCCDDSGIDNGASLEHQATLGQDVVDSVEDLLSQLVFGPSSFCVELDSGCRTWSMLTVLPCSRVKPGRSPPKGPGLDAVAWLA